jgi:HAE1 family hydrophobic/amphiphilic exporter-1
MTTPVAGVPVAGAPVAGVPVAGVPVAGAPEEHTPEEGPPEQGAWEESAPQEGVPEAAEGLEGGWAALAVDRPVATFMLMVAVVVFGWVSLAQLPVNLMPELQYPTLTVRTEYPGAAPEEVEESITDAIEELVGTVEGVVAVSSVSRAGWSDVQLRFTWGTDLDQASQKVRERLALIQFPDEAEPPLLLRFDPSLEPILRLAISGSVEPRLLRRYADEELVPALEKVTGVAMVRVMGGDEEIVRVALDEGRLRARGLDIQTVVERLRAENVNVAGGSILDGDTEYLVRTLNELRTLDEIENLIVARSERGAVRLRDVGEVTRTLRERRVVTRVNGESSVELGIFQEADANLVAVAEAVTTLLYGPTRLPADERPAEATPAPEEAGQAGGGPGTRVRRPLADQAPEGIRVVPLSDQSLYVRRAIAEVGSTAWIGGLCAVAVMLLFLRNVYATLIIGLAIPLSVIATFAPMRMMGVSLNIMSLGGLALGIGMLVDNAVVVLESIVRWREQGLDARSAAVRGTREVGAAVTASTLTTVAVFLPIAFVEGVAGQLFRDLALTVVLSLLASLVQALFVVPMLSVLPARWSQGVAERGALTRWQPAQLRAPMRAWTEARAWGVDAWRGWSQRPATARALLAPLVPLVAAWWLVRLVVLGALEALLRALTLVGMGLVWLGLGVGWTLRLVWRWSLGVVLDAFAWGLDRVRNAYTWLLGGALRAGWLVVGLAVGLGWFAWQEAGTLGTQLLPELHQNEFRVRVHFPVGTRLSETAATLQRAEAGLAALPEVRRVSMVAGRRDDTVERADEGEHTAEITVLLHPSDAPVEREVAVMAQARLLLAGIPGARYELTRPTLFSLAAPVTVEIRGWQLDALRATADAVREGLLAIDGVEDVRTSTGQGYPEVRIRFDRELLAARGLDVRQVAETVRRKVQGEVATALREQGRSLDLEVRVREDDVTNMAALRGLAVGQARQTSAGQLQSATGVPLAGSAGSTERATATLAQAAGQARTGTAAAGEGDLAVLLGSVADVSIAEGPAEIRHLDGSRAAVVEAGTSLLDLGRVTEAAWQVVHAVPVRSGQTVQVAGQADELAASQRNLGFALALAVFLVYVVMASTFESLVGPLVILLTIPLALTGVVGVLRWLGLPVSVVVVMGVIVLAGIVVNNAIVLVDSMMQRLREGLGPREAVQTACAQRLRPVLITTVTTVLGLVPMALSQGEGAEIRTPMAWTVIGGLVAGTMLTLVVIPVVFRGTVGRFVRADS